MFHISVPLREGERAASLPARTWPLAGRRGLVPPQLVAVPEENQLWLLVSLPIPLRLH